MHNETKKKLLILQGPPCSGKSTFAAKFVKEYLQYYIINRDTIRCKLGNGKYVLDKEDEVTKIENELMESAYRLDYNIISDNTNLNPKTINKLEKWANEHDYEIEYKKFYVPYAEAIKRSKQRRDEGGLYISRSVIQGFYKKYNNEEFQKEMTDSRINDLDNFENKLQKCVIVDLDGTVALHKRSPFDWENIPTDTLDTRLSFILKALQTYGTKIIFLSGRPKSQNKLNIFDLTRDWLLDNGFSDFELFMRHSEDFRSGEIVKKEIYEKEIKGKYNIVASFDDSNKCVDMWRNEGILCLQPENGDY